ncbi:hypothetical protein MMC10_003458 [Thelotrema lepadinum]|nr:hypothetical protein [Thelotrema lepadinum]
MSLLRNVFLVLLLASILSNLYLYSYPAFKDCHFPAPEGPGHIRHSLWKEVFNRFTGHAETSAEAPFRLLALGDPQLEGDTSIVYDLNDSYKPAKLRSNLALAPSFGDKARVLSKASYHLVSTGIFVQLKAWRKRIDLLGNDYYLAHVYNAIRRHTKPTHVTVLGDLLGSQWIDDAEFEHRASRYWTRVFRDGLRADEKITAEPTIEVLGEDNGWNRRVINIAGNHDIGYAGDLTPERVTRFEKAFGAVNWEVVFQLPLVSSIASASGEGRASEPAFLRLVVLNSMNLDTPAKHPELQSATYDFLNEVITRSEPVENRSVGTILLTHIPLYKDEGVCVDGPYFSFHDNGSGVKEQNHLSYDASKGVVEGLFGYTGNPGAPGKGLGRKGLILSGHDHEGCDVFHHLPQAREGEGWETRRWNATKWEEASETVNASMAGTIPGIREVTLRSMMGEYGGWSYLISGWFEAEKNEWMFDVKRCSAGVQHWWWAAHILVLITAASGLASLIVVTKPEVKPATKKPEKIQVPLLPKRPRAGTFGLGNIDDLSWEPPPESPVAKGTGTGTELVGNGHVKKRRP